MEFYETDLPGVIVVEPKVLGDQRGFFLETYRKHRFAEEGIDCDFVQDNCSRSAKGTLRGLHYQIENAQAKLVQAVRGEIFDVAVDLRRESAYFGRWVGVRLSEENRRQVFIPAGFAHGFYVLSETADVFYKCSNYYAPEHERTLLWNDPRVNVDWPLDGEPTLSEKDRRGRLLEACEVYDTTP